MATTDRPTTNPHLLAWVDEMAKLCKPERVVWCDGSEAEKKRLTEQAVEQKVLIPLDQKKWPGCYYHHSNPNDVARVEHLTFICTPTREEAGPTNNWMEPKDAYRKLAAIASSVSRRFSSAEPSHQWMRSGLHIFAISSTHARSAGLDVGRF